MRVSISAMTATSASPSEGIVYAPLCSKCQQAEEDRTAPLRISAPSPSEDQQAEALARMLARYVRGKRVKISLLAFSIHGRRSQMLPGSTIMIDCADAAQAEMALEAMRRFARSLDGIWLAPASASPTPGHPTPGPKPPREGEQDADGLR